ncbi:MAG: glycosyltransferase family 1 protein [Chloroflexi bacterium]|nr:glycosyltransferase family 1 protein [Chloroflexota bacterium]
MRVAFNAYFRRLPDTGSGQYLGSLVQALRAGYPDIVINEHTPPRILSGHAGKVAWEQALWPWRARGALGHAPYLAPPLLAPGTVVTVHDLIPLAMPAYRAGRGQALYFWLVRAGLRRARTLIADSESTRSDLARLAGVSSGRVHVVPLGVDERFRPGDAATRSHARQRLGLPERFGLFLSTRDLRKNLGVVLAAWPEVWRTCRLPLVVAGRSPRQASRVYVDWFADLDPSAKDWLHVYGPVDERDKPDLYRAADVFVFPSRYEGFGLDPLEAMASGVPVIAARATSLPEVVGDAGPLLPPDEPAAWSDAIAAMACDSAAATEMRERGLARAATFTWARTAERTHAVYRQASI